MGAQEFAENYGRMGLLFIQVNPLTPVPTAVLVVAGMLSKMNERDVFVVLVLGEFCTLLLNSIVVRFPSQGKTVEECLREQFKPEGADDEEDDEEDEDDKKEDKKEKKEKKE